MRSKRCSCALVTGTTLLVMLGTALTGSGRLDAESISQESDQILQGQAASGEQLNRVDFPGGTCGEYVDLLRKLFPNQSVVLAPGVSGFGLPPINVAINSIRPGLELACGIEGQLVYEARGGLTASGSLELDHISNDVWRLVGNQAPQQNTTRSRNGRPVGAQSSGTHLKAYAAHNLIESGLTIEEVMNALDISFSMSNQAKPPIVVQEQTLIIFMRGTADQIESFEETVIALEESAGHRFIQNARKKRESGTVDEETRSKNRKKALEHIQRQLSE